MLEKELIQKKVWAVVGANQDPEKYGNIIYMFLKRKGYTVFAVNPRYSEIEGDPCYPDLAALPERPEVLNMVVSPKRGRAVLEEATKLGIKYVWFQPGSCDEQLLEYAQEQGLEAVQACILLLLGYKGH